MGEVVSKSLDMASQFKLQVEAELMDETVSRSLDKALQLKREGNELFNIGCYENAIEKYSQAIRVCPEDRCIEMAKFYQNRAASFHALKQWRKVIDDCSEALFLNGAYEKARVRRSDAFEQLGRMEEAIQDLFMLIPMETPGANEIGHELDFLNMLDEYCENEGKRHISSLHFQLPASHVVTPHFELFTKNGFIDGNVKDIHELLKKRSEISNDNAKINALDGTIQFLKQDYKRAMQLFKKARCSSSNSDKDLQVYVLIMLGLSTFQCMYLSEEEDDDEEIFLNVSRYFDEAEKIDSSNGDIYFHRATLLEYLCDDAVEEVIEMLRKSVECSPTNVTAKARFLHLRVVKALRDKDVKTAERLFTDFREMIKQCPKSKQLLFYFAMTAEAYGGHSLNDCFNVLFKRNLRDKDYTCYRALMYSFTNPNDFKLSTQLLEEAVKMAEDCQAIHIQLARMYENGKQFERSLHHIEEALRLTYNEYDCVWLIRIRTYLKCYLTVLTDPSPHLELRRYSLYNDRFAMSSQLCALTDNWIKQSRYGNYSFMRFNRIKKKKSEKRTKSIKMAMYLNIEGNKIFKYDDYEKRIEKYGEAITRCPDGHATELAVYYHNRAAMYAGLKNWTKVVEDCTEAIRLNGMYVNAINRRMKAFVELGSIENAVNDAFQLCTFSSLSDEEFWNNCLNYNTLLHEMCEKRGRVLFSSRERMVFPLQKWLTQQLVISHFQLFKKSGIKRRYLEEMSQIGFVSESGNNMDARLQRLAIKGTIEFLNLMYSKAEQDFQKVVASGCDNKDLLVYSLIMLALCTFHKMIINDVECDVAIISKITSYFDAAVKIDANNCDIYFHRSPFFVHIKNGDYTSAIEDLEKCVRLSHSHLIARAKLLYLKTFTMTKESMRVIDSEYLSLLQRYPNSKHLIFYYAASLINMKRLDKKVSFVHLHRCAMKCESNDKDYGVYKAFIFSQMERCDRQMAIKFFEAAVSADRDCQFAYEELSRMYADVGEYENALHQVKKAICLTRTEKECIHLLRLEMLLRHMASQDGRSVGRVWSELCNIEFNWERVYHVDNWITKHLYNGLPVTPTGRGYMKFERTAFPGERSSYCVPVFK